MLHCALGDREQHDDADAVCSKILEDFLCIKFLFGWAEEKMFASAFRSIELHSRY